MLLNYAYSRRKFLSPNCCICLRMCSMISIARPVRPCLPRKLPIVFAGILWNNQATNSVATSFPNRFGEDMQTVYVDWIPPTGAY